MLKLREVGSRKLLIMVAFSLGIMLLVLASNSPEQEAQAQEPTPWTLCSTYQVGQDVWAGPNPIAVTINVPLCMNGERIWKGDWGPDCEIEVLWGEPSVSWCGVYNNGGSFVNPGTNFNVFLPPFGPSFACYMRFEANSGGSITKKWGGC